MGGGGAKYAIAVLGTLVIRTEGHTPVRRLSTCVSFLFGLWFLLQGYPSNVCVRVCYMHTYIVDA